MCMQACNPSSSSWSNNNKGWHLASHLANINTCLGQRTARERERDRETERGSELGRAANWLVASCAASSYNQQQPVTTSNQFSTIGCSKWSRGWPQGQLSLLHSTPLLLSPFCRFCFLHILLPHLAKQISILFLTSLWDLLRVCLPIYSHALCSWNIFNSLILCLSVCLSLSLSLCVFSFCFTYLIL